MISLEQALKIIEEVEFVPSKEQISLFEAEGRVLASDFHAPFDYPNFSSSAMDGFAIADRQEAVYQIVARVAAGDSVELILQKNQCVEIFTGGIVPANAVQVVRKEFVQREGNQIKIVKQENLSNIRQRGEDFKQGDLILASGIRLTPQRLAILASFGLKSVDVFRLPSVAIISTGSELLPAGEDLKTGKIYDSNRPFLETVLQRDRARVVFNTSVADRLNDLCAVLLKAEKDSELIVISGGVSEGDLDLVPAALQAIGAEILLHKVEIKPGKPVLFARKANRFFFGLPGNPVSTVVDYELFVRPLLYKMSGSRYKPLIVTATMKREKLLKKGDRLRILPVFYEENRVECVQFHGSAHLGVFAQANGLLFVPARKELLQKGETVNVRLL